MLLDIRLNSTWVLKPITLWQNWPINFNEPVLNIWLINHYSIDSEGWQTRGHVAVTVFLVWHLSFFLTFFVAHSAFLSPQHVAWNLACVSLCIMKQGQHYPSFQCCNVYAAFTNCSCNKMEVSLVFQVPPVLPQHTSFTPACILPLHCFAVYTRVCPASCLHNMSSSVFWPNMNSTQVF